MHLQEKMKCKPRDLCVLIKLLSHLFMKIQKNKQIAKIKMKKTAKRKSKKYEGEVEACI